jgi:hypothetical protein
VCVCVCVCVCVLCLHLPQYLRVSRISLRVLSLQNNRLTGCPSLARLARLERVELLGNPLQPPLSTALESVCVCVCVCDCVYARA